jgi:hypothetical protein
MELGLKKGLVRVIFAGMILFAHTTSMASEGLSLTFKTISGYTNPLSEGTWVNDLTDCLHGRPTAAGRVPDDEPGVIRPIVARLCPYNYRVG